MHLLCGTLRISAVSALKLLFNAEIRRDNAEKNEISARIDDDWTNAAKRDRQRIRWCADAG